MNISNLQKDWNLLGKKDALRAALYRREKWEVNEFYLTGQDEIASILADIVSLQVRLKYGKALDFGCGAGRLSQALAGHFDEVYGIDIAPSMIELANKYNRYPQKCKYYVNNKCDLTLFGDNMFDLIYSNITLQHMRGEYAKKYIDEFLRVLSKEGLLIFQMPSSPARTVKGFLIQLIPEGILNLYRRVKYGPEMYAMEKKEVIKYISGIGGAIISIKENQSAGNNWISFAYYIRK